MPPKKDSKKTETVESEAVDMAATVTETVIDVLRSLNVIDEDGRPKIQKVETTKEKKGLYGDSWSPYVASNFSMSDPGAALDDVLSESSKLPIFQVPGARAGISAAGGRGVTQGPVDVQKMRMAAAGPGGTDIGWGRGTTSFMGLQMDPLIGNSFSMLNFSLSRSNPYMVNRMYGSGMYGDIPVYFLMMQEQNGGLLYWPVSIREKYQWYRYFVRTDPYVGAAIDLHTDLPISRIGFTMPKLKNDPDGSKSKNCLHKVQKWANTIELFDRIMECMYEWHVIGNCFPANHRVHTPEGMVPICEIREGDLVLTHKGRYKRAVSPMRRKVRERLISIDIDNLPGFKFTPTKEHPILVLRDNKEDFVEAQNLRRGDYVSLWHIDPKLSERYGRNEIVDVVGELKQNKVLDSRYDSVEFSDDLVTLSYRTTGGVSYKTAEIKEKVLDWVAQLKAPVVKDCLELAEELEISDPKRLRNVAYSLRKKGAIKSECIRNYSKDKEKVASAIKWYPLEEKRSVNEIYHRNWTKELDIGIREFSLDNDFFYLLGYWLGDGWIWKNKRPKSYAYMAWDICISPKDKSSYNHLSKICTNVFGKNNVNVQKGSYCNDDMYHVKIEDPLFCEWWAYNFGENSSSKKLPEWVLHLDKEKLSYLLGGLIDSDGCATKSIKEQNIVSISTTTERLMQSIFKIGLKCGIPFSFAKIKSRKAKMPQGNIIDSGKNQFKISTSRTDKVKSAHLDKTSRKVAQLKLDSCSDILNKNVLEFDGKFYYRIRDIDEKFYDGYVYNFEVESDHSYCVENVNTHNCFAFSEWCDEHKWWKRITVLPPEEVGIIHFPFCDFAFAEYKPEPLIRLIAAVGGDMEAESSQETTPLEKAIYENIPQDVVKSVQQFGSIIMDTDPNTGSFVAHLARKRSPYADLGVSTLERVIIPLLQKEHFKYTQLSLSSRLMTPRNKISAPGISPDATDNLRAEVDMSMEDPDYHVVTNFDFSWELIGAENRLIALQPEYERIENEILAALGVTRELITGEASYGGARITAEILNTRYLLVRDIFKNFVENKLLKPMAIKNGWFEEDEEGNREYYYPQLTFNRLTIRDNQEMFDALFQLYQKGSLPIQVIYELFNLNPDEMNDILVDDLFTARDATFNEMLRQVHTDMGSKIVEGTDLFDRMVKYLGLSKADEEGNVKTTPAPDLGGDVFTPPAEEEEKPEREEGAAPEEEGAGGAEEEAGAEEAEAGGGAEEEEGGGFFSALEEEGGGEEGGGEEVIEEEAPVE
jgi:intein/homing endonuclease